MLSRSALVLVMFCLQQCLVLHQVGLEAPGTVDGRGFNQALTGVATGAFYQGASLFGELGQQESEVAQAAVLTGIMTRDMVGGRDDAFYTLRSTHKCIKTIEQGGAVIVNRVFSSMHSCPVGPAKCPVQSGKAFAAALESVLLFREHACQIQAAGTFLAIGDLHF